LAGGSTFHEGDGCVAEALASGLGCRHRGELGRVGPATDGQERLDMPVLFLKEVELLDAAIGVLARVVPRVCGVTLLEVRVRVGRFSGQR
jgi:hypothetical protein